MEWFNYFIVQNFILICILIVVVVNVLQHFNLNKRVSAYSITIMGLTFLLALSITLENYGKSIASIPLATIFALVGYIIRPIVIYLFILMSYKKIRNKLFYLTTIPLTLNMIIYLLALIPGMGKYIVEFGYNDLGGISFGGGPLRFTSHIIASLYMIWWFYNSIIKFKAKHLNQAITILTCGVFVILAVVIETFFNANGDIFLLNTTIGLSVLSYYLYIYTESTQVDVLTGLFQRSTYYRDLPKMRKSTTSVIQFDINGLKYLNDNFGHEEGDLAIKSIAGIINKNAKRNMYGYRLGGDEFIVLVLDGTNEQVDEYIRRIKDDLSNTNYHCSIGVSFQDGSLSYDELVKRAETNMYKDKDEYYKTSNIKRR